MNIRTIVAVTLAFLMPACQQVELENGNKSKELSFNVGFDIEKEVISRAELGDYIATLQVFDYKDGTLVNSITQGKEDAGFGTVPLKADYGTHEYVFVGHNSVSCNYDNEKSELTFDKILDTFTATQTLEVNIDTEEKQSVKMERQVAGIKLVMQDAIPQNADCIELTVEGYSSVLNPKTGKGSVGIKHIRKWEYSTSNIGKTGTSYTLYTFLPTENHIVDMSIRMEGSDGKDIIKYTIKGIDIEKNRITVISGNLLSKDTTSSVDIEGEWEHDIEINI